MSRYWRERERTERQREKRWWTGKQEEIEEAVEIWEGAIR